MKKIELETIDFDKLEKIFLLNSPDIVIREAYKFYSLPEEQRPSVRTRYVSNSAFEDNHIEMYYETDDILYKSVLLYSVANRMINMSTYTLKEIIEMHKSGTLSTVVDSFETAYNSLVQYMADMYDTDTHAKGILEWLQSQENISNGGALSLIYEAHRYAKRARIAQFTSRDGSLKSNLTVTPQIFAFTDRNYALAYGSNSKDGIYFCAKLDVDSWERSHFFYIIKDRGALFFVTLFEEPKNPIKERTRRNPGKDFERMHGASAELFPFEALLNENIIKNEASTTALAIHEAHKDEAWLLMPFAEMTEKQQMFNYIIMRNLHDKIIRDDYVAPEFSKTPLIMSGKDILRLGTKALPQKIDGDTVLKLESINNEEASLKSRARLRDRLLNIVRKHIATHKPESTDVALLTQTLMPSDIIASEKEMKAINERWRRDAELSLMYKIIHEERKELCTEYAKKIGRTPYSDLGFEMEAMAEYMSSLITPQMMKKIIPNVVFCERDTKHIPLNRNKDTFDSTYGEDPLYGAVMKSYKSEVLIGTLPHSFYCFSFNGYNHKRISGSNGLNPVFANQLRDESTELEKQRYGKHIANTYPYAQPICPVSGGKCRYFFAVTIFDFTDLEKIIDADIDMETLPLPLKTFTSHYTNNYIGNTILDDHIDPFDRLQKITEIPNSKFNIIVGLSEEGLKEWFPSLAVRTKRTKALVQ